MKGSRSSGGAVERVAWHGVLTSVQPRIRLTRSFDERSHTYLGYTLRVKGAEAGTEQEILVAVGKGAQAKHGFRVGDAVAGEGVPVADPRMETAALYKVTKLKLVARSDSSPVDPPPWIGVPPSLEVYRDRGHRRLAARTFDTKCSSCLWGCRMPVEMIIDHWNPSQRRYRTETFCYGPLSCSFYKPGPTRRVPGRRGMVYEEADWVDQDAVSHRDIDD